jgi:hypothetical protein
VSGVECALTEKILALCGVARGAGIHWHLVDTTAATQRGLELVEQIDAILRDVRTITTRFDQAIANKDMSGAIRARDEMKTARAVLDSNTKELKFITAQLMERAKELDDEMIRVGADLDPDEIRAVLADNPQHEFAAELREELQRRTEKPMRLQ